MISSGDILSNKTKNNLMGMNFNNTVASGSSSLTRKRRYSSEINVTPMVDVMLVLLIIFMIASPMLVGGIQVELPKTDSAAISSNFKPLIVSIDKDARIFLFETEVQKEALTAKLEEILKANLEAGGSKTNSEDIRIFVKGDRNVSYGVVAEIMSMIQNAGYVKVALLSDI